MDMNTIEAVVRTADPADWQAGDAWLAGGTVLFSYGSFAFGKEPLRRLSWTSASTGWPAVTVSDAGIELAATCTIARSCTRCPPATPAGHTRRLLAALELIRPCCDSFVASFKVWNMSTVGGNLCTSLPAGPMISLCAALDGVATVLGPGGASRTVPVTDFVTGDARNCLAPGELSASSSSRHRPLPPGGVRRLSLSNLDGSGSVIGRLDADGTLVLTVAAATKRPVQLRLASPPRCPTSPTALAEALDAAVRTALPRRHPRPAQPGVQVLTSG